MTDEDGLTTRESWDERWSTAEAKKRPRAPLRTDSQWVQLLADFLDAPGEQSLDVLELGCAPGTMLLELHRLRPQHRYRGIDFAAGGLNIARRRLADAGVSAELIVGDIRTAHIRQADLVMSFGLVEHFADPVEALRYHRRFVKPKGMVAVTVPNYSHPAVAWLLARFSPATLATHNPHLMATGAMATALAAAGFADIRVGQGGPAKLPTSRAINGPKGKAYKLFARIWNRGTRVLPEGKPWPLYVWATATNPAETTDETTKTPVTKMDSDTSSSPLGNAGPSLISEEDSI